MGFRRGRRAVQRLPAATAVLPSDSEESRPGRASTRWATVVFTFFRPRRLFSSEAE